MAGREGHACVSGRFPAVCSRAVDHSSGLSANQRRKKGQAAPSQQQSEPVGTKVGKPARSTSNAGTRSPPASAAAAALSRADGRGVPPARPPTPTPTPPR